LSTTVSLTPRATICRSTIRSRSAWRVGSNEGKPVSEPSKPSPHPSTTNCAPSTTEIQNVQHLIQPLLSPRREIFFILRVTPHGRPGYPLLPECNGCPAWGVQPGLRGFDGETPS